MLDKQSKSAFSILYHHNFLLALFIVLFIGACQLRNTVSQGIRSPEIHDQYLVDLDHFNQSLDKLLNSYDQLDEVQDRFEVCRLAFKKIEYLLEFMDDERHAYFNGPPVVKEDKASPGFNVVEPEGLQVLEEMICESIPDKIHFETTISELQYQTRLWRSYLADKEISDDQWTRAALIHLIRIESLSLAGFDRPCKGASIQEIILSFESIRPISSSDPLIEEHFTQILEILHATDSPVDLPMAEFIRNHIQPLRKAIIKQLKPIDNLPVTPYDLGIASLYQANFINASFYSNHGVVDKEDPAKAALGKKLFFDPLLSANQNMSCNTCHQADRFFTDQLTLSKSNLPGGHLKRNTPTLIHAAYQQSFMYDGRSASLEDQLLHVFSNPKEFSSHSGHIIQKLEGIPEYNHIFESLYPEMMPKAINLHSLTDVLAIYVRSLNGHNAPFDRFMRGESEIIDSEVLDGFQIFMTKGQCATCHFAPSFSGLIPPFYSASEFENLGVPMIDSSGNWTVDHDEGRYNFYEHKAFLHFFKTSTVRNSSQTAPYMHNGVFASLDEVVDFYNQGGGVGKGLIYPNQSLPAGELLLNDKEIANLIHFIESLTDAQYLIHPTSN